MAVALSGLALAVSSWVWAPAGQAGDRGHEEGIMCTGDSESAYDPPLTLTSRPTRIHVHARYGCTVAPGRTVPAEGTLEATSPGTSCLTFGTSTHAEERVTYADGRRSVIVYDRGTTVRIAGVQFVRLSGRVVEGRGAGHAAERTVPARSGELPTECLSSGLPGSEGSALLEVRP
ncbi:hypothetical protein AB0K09_21905 [Streptomyces sp. NPDC049577]|uniref:hypothetical protein n=1 Tax=Streptomyces sp. NPDC049577 TaxID=3155153 RepID=UPI00344A9D32